ncbi:MAG: prepilin-type N-terminal cleavage/methylation domain-containing protein [Minicystis sp.]
MSARTAHRRGFTLLEVLVAVAILGLGLTAILSAQAGAFSSAAYARNISVATGLLRCKMSEVEEHLYKDGFQEADESGSGPCCEGDDNPNFRCNWRVDRPTFPEARFGDLNLDSALNFGSSGGSGGPAGGLGALGLLSGAAPGGSPLAGASGLGDVAKTLADANAQAISGVAPPTGDQGSSSSGAPATPGAPGAAPGDPGAAGMGGLASLAMSFVYPSLKLVFEASTRRITATVIFREGSKERTVDVVEWFTMPQKGITVDDQSAADNSTANSITNTNTNTTRTPNSNNSSSGGRNK